MLKGCQAWNLQDECSGAEYGEEVRLMVGTWRGFSRVYRELVNSFRYSYSKENLNFSVLGMLGRKIELGKGKITFKEKKLPQLCPGRGSHGKTTKALPRDNVLAYWDQAKPVPTRSQCGSNRTKLRNAQTTPHHRKGQAH